MFLRHAEQYARNRKKPPQSQIDLWHKNYIAEIPDETWRYNDNDNSRAKSTFEPFCQRRQSIQNDSRHVFCADIRETLRNRYIETLVHPHDDDRCVLFFFSFLSRVPRPINHRVGRSVRSSVGLSHFFFAFLGILRVGKFVFEHAPAQNITARDRGCRIYCIRPCFSLSLRPQLVHHHDISLKTYSSTTSMFPHGLFL